MATATWFKLQSAPYILIQCLLLTMNHSGTFAKTEIPETATMVTPCTDTVSMENAKLNIYRATASDPDNTTQSIFVYGISDECYECLYLPLSLHSLSDGDICVHIDTRHPFSIGYSHQSPFSGCSLNQTTCVWEPSSWIIRPESYHYREYEHYYLVLEDDAGDEPVVYRETVRTASDKHIPLYVAFALIVAGIIAYNIYRVRTKSHNTVDARRSQRVVALDAFRGLSLIIMIFVNLGGGGYWWLEHSTWNGLTVADLVFPWFIFMMGAAMAIVFPRKLEKLRAAFIDPDPVDIEVVTMRNDDGMKQGADSLTIESADGGHPTVRASMKRSETAFVSRWTLTKTVLIRGAKLFVIGLLVINHAFDLKHIRVPGVLQYFAVSYIINSLLLIWLDPVGITSDSKRPSPSNLFVPEVVLYWKQWLIIVLMLIIYLIVTFVPEITIYGDRCGSGYVGPGGIGDFGEFVECTGGMNKFVDWKLFGSNHVYHYPTAQSYYATGWYDPEGFMGAISATFLTFFGVLVGRILTVYNDHRQRILRWTVWLLIFGLVAGSLCGFKKNGGPIPINKNLWSFSFICCQASTGILVLMLFYVLIDILNVWSGLPFHWLGSNSIFIYVGSIIFDGYFPFGFEFGEEHHAKLLVSNLIGVSVWIAIAGYLFRKKKFYAL